MEIIISLRCPLPAVYHHHHRLRLCPFFYACTDRTALPISTKPSSIKCGTQNSPLSKLNSFTFRIWIQRLFKRVDLWPNVIADPNPTYSCIQMYNIHVQCRELEQYQYANKDHTQATDHHRTN